MPQICQSGYQGPDDGAQSTTIVCSAAPVNTNAIKTGTAAAGDCPLTIVPAKGGAAVAAGKTTSVCGYNIDAMFYCPWQLGDAVPSAAIAALAPIMAYASQNCNPGSQGIMACKAVVSKYSDVAATYAKALLFVNDVVQLGPLVVNNAPCVQSAITMAYFGFSASSFGMIGAIFTVLAMLF